MRFVVVCLLLFAQRAVVAEEQPPEPPKSLKTWQGTWNVLDSQASAGIEFVIGDKLGLAKDAKATLRGNQLFVDNKLVATLTTDFSQSHLGVEKQVRVGRVPILFTLPDGMGILCAAEFRESGIEIVHPHAMGNVGAGSRLYLQQSKSEPQAKE
jgi:hypothetical protein